MLETNQRISRIIPIEKNDFSTKINGFVIDKSIDVKTNVVEYLPRVYETDFANKGFANVVFVSEEYTKIFLDWLQEIKEWHNPRDLFLPAANGNYSWYHIILQNSYKDPSLHFVHVPNTLSLFFSPPMSRPAFERLLLALNGTARVDAHAWTELQRMKPSRLSPCRSHRSRARARGASSP